MTYTETLPDNIFTHHIESYWDMPILNKNGISKLELLLPTCTFNIIFTDQTCMIKTHPLSDWVVLEAGASFFGQRTSCIYIKSDVAIKISGVRFKPFAFANIINMPIFQLNDGVTHLNELFEITPSADSLIHDIIITQELSFKTQLLNELMHLLFKDSFSIDEKLRAQLNYIMDRKGSVKVSEIFNVFNVSKVTLNKHFKNKVGLSPKRVAQIWRMNYLLQMKEENPSESLTSLSLNAGYYDQAHFIKDFKMLFGSPPRSFFLHNTQLLKVEHQNISKRFTNQYDPR